MLCDHHRSYSVSKLVDDDPSMQSTRRLPMPKLHKLLVGTLWQSEKQQFPKTAILSIAAIMYDSSASSLPSLIANTCVLSSYSILFCLHTAFVVAEFVLFIHWLPPLPPNS